MGGRKGWSRGDAVMENPSPMAGEKPSRGQNWALCEPEKFMVSHVFYRTQAYDC